MIPIYPENFPNNIDQNQEHEVIFESLIDGTRWKRTGYCSNCGDCCNDDIDGFLETDANGNSPGIMGVVHGKCAYFRWNEQGKSECLGRGTHYHNIACSYHPSKPEHIINWPNCTYRFEQVI